jgi:hypothetical protein
MFSDDMLVKHILTLGGLLFVYRFCAAARAGMAAFGGSLQ